MNLAIKNFLARFANSGSGERVLRPVRKLSSGLDALITYTDRQRSTGAREDLKSMLLRREFPDLTVLNGPLTGLKYADAIASGSAFLPKLLGSYESEIADFIERAITRNPTDVVDVGSAEGYYAIGLALRLPKAEIHAFDVDAHARQLCQRMADLNGVSDRLHLREFCDPEALAALPYKGRALIFSDCEGYEETLFSEASVAACAPHDLIIECHDFKSPTISTGIRTAFAKTHDIFAVQSMPTYQKAHEANRPQMKPYNFEIQKFMVDEARRVPVVWLYLQSKQ
ncbi:MAG: hypothetical protein AAFV87_03945 [Pseudomonadota bacterium]